MRALDLYSKAGGAGMGLYRAGFDVFGVDIEPQPNYPFWFKRADALNSGLDLRAFDFIWASPVCKKFTKLAARHPDREYPDTIAETRDMLLASGVPFVIENVPDAPLINPIILCGSSFGLKVRRHRAFECHGFTFLAPECQHADQGQPIDVTGTGGNRKGDRLDGKGGNPRKPRSLEEAREAMGIDWMTRAELSQAIPPAFAEMIGRAAIAAIQHRQAA